MGKESEENPRRGHLLPAIFKTKTLSLQASGLVLSSPAPQGSLPSSSQVTSLLAPAELSSVA